MVVVVVVVGWRTGHPGFSGQHWSGTLGAKWPVREESRALLVLAREHTQGPTVLGTSTMEMRGGVKSPVPYRPQ